MTTDKPEECASSRERRREISGSPSVKYALCGKIGVHLWYTLDICTEAPASCKCRGKNIRSPLSNVSARV